MDKISPQKRSDVMSSVKSKGTKLENFFAQEMINQGVKFSQRNVTNLIGKPDFIFKRKKIAILIDSCFWHGCKKHLRLPASNQVYWTAKIARNRKKDRQVTKKLKEEGWLVLRIWEHSLRNPTKLRWWMTHIKNIIK